MISQEMLVLYGKNKPHCKFTSVVPSCHHALDTASFLLSICILWRWPQPFHFCITAPLLLLLYLW